MKKIIKTLCFLLTVFALTLSVTACNKEDYSYWQIDAQQAGEARLVYVAELSFGTTNIDVTEIWINLSNFKAQSTTITVKLAKTTTSVTTLNCPVTAEEVKNAKDGWIQLYFDSAVNCKSATIEIVDTMRVNEIYFVKDNGKSAEPTFASGGVKMGTSANLYDKATLEGLGETNPTDRAYSEHPSFNIIDEQDKFPVEKIQTK